METVIKACVVLHNLLITPQETVAEAMRKLRKEYTQSHHKETRKQREKSLEELQSDNEKMMGLLHLPGQRFKA